MGSRLESNSKAINKRILEHNFENEEGDEYESSKFGGFGDYFRRKKIKLQNLDAEIRQQNADKPQIFRGITVHVNGYTQPSLNDLHLLIASHGGGFMQYLDGKTTVTHIVASNLTPKKVVDFKSYRIVKPAWIVDSVKEGRLLPWGDYRLVDEGQSQKVLQFKNGSIVSQVNDLTHGYRYQTDTSWYTEQLKRGEGKGSSSIDEGHDDPAEVVTAQREEFSPAEIDQHTESNDSPDELQTVEDFGKVESAVPPFEPESVARPQYSIANLTENKRSHSPQPNAVETNVSGGENLTDTHLSGIHTESGADDEVYAQDSAANPAPMTAEEHNTVLLSDPRIRESSVLNPEFLEKYYSTSRLHHLSTWKANLKSQLQALTAEKSASQKPKHKRESGSRRYILHVDFDSFFVAVSLKNHPEYVDKPACVAHGAGPGSEIASCNYPARTFGVKNGMWMKRANEMCKDLKVLPYDFAAYEACSRLFYDAILATGGLVQSVSIDEALIDVTSICLAAGGTEGRNVREGSIWREQAKVDEIAQGLRDRVKEETGCAVSVGIGGNILLAKVALRKAKPAGQYHVKPEETLDFIADLQVQDLPGVAYSIGGKLEDIGVKFVKDIRELSKEKLINTLGPKTGQKIWNYARGIDHTEVGDQVVRKSVSAEVNWGVRFETQEQAEEFVDSLCGELAKRLLKEQVKGRQLTMKIMRRAQDAPRDPPKHLGHGKCDTYNKSIVLGVSTNAADVLAKEATSVLRGFGFSPGELRGIGVQMTKLEPLKKTDVVGVGSQRQLQFASKSSDTAAQFKAGPSNPIKSLQEESVPKPARADSLAEQRPLPTKSTARKQLNTLGTQFLLPSQVDEEALAALPPNIRSRLFKHIERSDETPQAEEKAKEKEPEPKTATDQTATSRSGLVPNKSQLDPSILNELPEDLRKEVLAHYDTAGQKPTGQTVLPQSPHKNRVLPPPRKGVSSRGRRGGTTLMARLKGPSSKGETGSTLTQANFVTHLQTEGVKSVAGDELEESAPEISSEFLEALPEDIRREVLAQHRAKTLKLHGGLEVHARRSPAKAQYKIEELSDTDESGTDDEERQPKRVLKLAPRDPPATFTTRHLSELDDLRRAISMWHKEFANDGPYKEDVNAFVRYLSKVILHERDISKASSVMKWLEWIIDNEQEEKTSEHKDSRADWRWRKACEQARDGMRESLKTRGLMNCEL